jgi:peptide/nickel transport system substrate-binding protein
MKELAWCNADVDYAADLGKAAQLLDEIGLKDVDNDGVREFPEWYPLPGRDVRFRLLVAKGEKIAYDEAETFQDTLKKLGIIVDLDSVNFAYISSTVFNTSGGNWDAVRISLGGGGDPTILAQVYSSCGAFHFYRYSDCDWTASVPQPSQTREEWQIRIDELFEQQAVEADFERRAEIARDLQRKIAENTPVVWSVMPRPICAFDYERLRNFSCANLWQDATLEDSEMIYVQR